MNLANVRAGLSSALENVNNLRVYEWVPSAVQPPAAVVSLGAGDYDQDFNDGVRCTFTAIIMLTRADDKHGQERLDEFLSQGNDSIFHVIDTDSTLGGSCDSARVTGWTEPGTFTIGGIDYLGVEVSIEVLG